MVQGIGLSKLVKAPDVSESTLSVPPKSAFLPSGIADIHKLHSAAQKLRGHLGVPGPADHSEDALISGLNQVRTFFRDSTRYIHTLNSLETPNSERDPRLGRAILPLTIMGFSEVPPEGNGGLLYKLYLKTHRAEAADEAEIKFEDWQLGIHTFASILPGSKDLPGYDAYLSQSLTLRSVYDDFVRRREEKKQQLVKQESVNTRGSMDDAIVITRGDLAKIESEAPKLFDRLDDVFPEDVPVCMNALSIKATPNAQLIHGAASLALQIEALLSMAVGSISSKAPPPMSIELPRLAEDGSAEVAKVTFSSAEVAVIKVNPALLTALLRTWVDARELLRAMLPTVEPFKDSEWARDTILRGLEQPFVIDTENGRRALVLLTELKSDDVRLATLDLIASRNTGSKDAPSEWRHTLEDSSTAIPLFWTAGSYLRTTLNDSLDPFREVLIDAPPVAKHMIPFLSRIKPTFTARNFQTMSQLLSAELREAGESTELFKLLSPFAFMSTAVAEPEVRAALKNQVPNITDVKKLMLKAAELSPSLRPELAALTDRILKGLSVTMQDFFKDPDMEELWEFLDRFKYFMANPQALEGVSGNEAMKSGILLAGLFGVGKTFFVTCLENELGIRKISLSPDEISDKAGGKMLHACKKVFEEAMKFGEKEFCILFIDEAEALAADRENPKTSAEQTELTCYMLQAINTIRERYPRILPVAATNYPDRIDEAMLRNGRFDIQIFMTKPSEKVRHAIIEQTLAREQVLNAITAEQLVELAKLTDDFMPLPIKRTINELVRIVLPAARKKMTFEILKAEYEKEKARKNNSISARVAQARALRHMGQPAPSPTTSDNDGAKP